MTVSTCCVANKDDDRSLVVLSHHNKMAHLCRLLFNWDNSVPYQKICLIHLGQLSLVVDLLCCCASQSGSGSFSDRQHSHNHH